MLTFPPQPLSEEMKCRVKRTAVYYQYSSITGSPQNECSKLQLLFCDRLLRVPRLLKGYSTPKIH